MIEGRRQSADLVHLRGRRHALGQVSLPDLLGGARHPVHRAQRLIGQHQSAIAPEQQRERNPQGQHDQQPLARRLQRLERLPDPDEIGSLRFEVLLRTQRRHAQLLPAPQPHRLESRPPQLQFEQRRQIDRQTVALRRSQLIRDHARLVDQLHHMRRERQQILLVPVLRNLIGHVDPGPRRQASLKLADLIVERLVDRRQQTPRQIHVNGDSE